MHNVYMSSEAQDNVNHINKSSSQERSDICKVIELYDNGKLTQNNYGAWVLLKNRENETSLNVYQPINNGDKQISFILEIKLGRTPPDTNRILIQNLCVVFFPKRDQLGKQFYYFNLVGKDNQRQSLNCYTVVLIRLKM